MNADPKTVLRNRYALQETLGRDAISTTYRAVDLRQQEAGIQPDNVAVKVLSDETVRNTELLFGLQEAFSRTRPVQCENVVTIYDYDKDDETRFVVMELLQGHTLATHLAQHDGRLPRKEALRIIRGICEGLALAHSKGLVHTDLSPASVFYTTDGIARVFDFGIGELIRAPEKRSVYASPEAGAADKSGDIFAAAVIAYELLSGRHPFAGEPATTASSAPARIFSLMPGTWRALAQALALAPSDRTASIQEFLSGLPKP